jgi:hypothetical protein
MRVDFAAAGPTGWLVLLLVPLVDSIMALRQLQNVKRLIERHGVRTEDPENPETGQRGQYQLHHVIYASGDEAGVPGNENAQQSRQRAEANGMV